MGKKNHYKFIDLLIDQWKPRAKKIDINLKDIAKDAKISAQHLTKIITKKSNNPRIATIDAVEMALYAAEEKFAEEVKKAGV